jgi:hypothetical protein
MQTIEVEHPNHRSFFAQCPCPQLLSTLKFVRAVSFAPEGGCSGGGRRGAGGVAQRRRLTRERLGDLNWGLPA